MEQEKKLLGFAIPKVICPICGQPFDYNGIIMNKRLGPKRAQKVEDMHGKIMGMSDTICPRCREKMKTTIFAILCDISTGIPKPTGKIMHIERTKEKEDMIYSVKGMKEYEQQYGYVFMEDTTINNKNK